MAHGGALIEISHDVMGLLSPIPGFINATSMFGGRSSASFAGWLVPRSLNYR